MTDKLYELFRLMILESVTQDGIKNYKQLKKDIINIFGFQEIFTIKELEQVGLLKDQMLFNKVKGLIHYKFSDVVEKFQLINQQKCSYVTGGYCPLTLRLIEQILKGGWYKIDEILRKIPGAVSYPSDEKSFLWPEKEKNIIFVVFLGGVTYAEIEGVRFLNRLLDQQYKKSLECSDKKIKSIKIIILTNCILNHKKVISQFTKKVKTKLTMKKYAQDLSKKNK